MKKIFSLLIILFLIISCEGSSPSSSDEEPQDETPAAETHYWDNYKDLTFNQQYVDETCELIHGMGWKFTAPESGSYEVALTDFDGCDMNWSIWKVSDSGNDLVRLQEYDHCSGFDDEVGSSILLTENTFYCLNISAPDSSDYEEPDIIHYNLKVTTPSQQSGSGDTGSEDDPVSFSGDVSMDLGYSGGGVIRGTIDTDHLLNASEVGSVNLFLITLDMYTGNITTQHAVTYTTKTDDISYSFSGLDTSLSYILLIEIQDLNDEGITKEYGYDENEADYHFHLSAGETLTLPFDFYSSNDGRYYEADKASVSGQLTLTDAVDYTAVDVVQIELEMEDPSTGDEVEIIYYENNPVSNIIDFEFINVDPAMICNLDYDLELIINNETRYIELGNTDDFTITSGSNTKNATAPDNSTEDEEYIQGTRYTWYKENVGLIKVLYNHDDGSVTTIELTNYTVTPGSGFFPLVTDNQWSYSRTNSTYQTSGAVTEEWECKYDSNEEEYIIDCTASNGNTGYLGLSQDSEILRRYSLGTSGSISEQSYFMNIDFFARPDLVLTYPLNTGDSWFDAMRIHGSYFGISTTNVLSTSETVTTPAETFNNVVKLETVIGY